jgi:hypothetical protein
MHCFVLVSCTFFLNMNSFQRQVKRTRNLVFTVLYLYAHMHSHTMMHTHGHSHPYVHMHTRPHIFMYGHSHTRTQADLTLEGHAARRTTRGGRRGLPLGTPCGQTSIDIVPGGQTCTSIVTGFRTHCAHCTNTRRATNHVTKQPLNPCRCWKLQTCPGDRKSVV